MMDENFQVPWKKFNLLAMFHVSILNVPCKTCQQTPLGTIQETDNFCLKMEWEIFR